MPNKEEFFQYKTMKKETSISFKKKTLFRKFFSITLGGGLGVGVNFIEFSTYVDFNFDQNINNQINIWFRSR